MALKKVAAAKAKKPVAKANKRGPKAKLLDEEEVVATQTPTKKGKKQPIPQAEPSDEESDASEDENGVNFEDGSESEGDEGGADGLIDSQAEEDDEEEEVSVSAKPLAASDDESDSDSDSDDDEEDEDDDEVEPGQITPAKKSKAADSDDEAPVEAPITKKGKKETGKGKKDTETEDATPKKGGIPKIPVARIPANTPKEQIIFVTNFPAEYKHHDLIALFNKFGPITVINRIKTKAGGSNAQIAFETVEAAEAALAAKEKAVTLNGSVLSISRPLTKDDINNRTVVVSLIGTKTNKTDIQEFFKKCGEIESVNFSNNRTNPTAFIRFKSVESVPNALKLHSTELNSRYISVREESYKKKSLKSAECTITIENVAKHESYKSDTIEKIFKKYGEIIDIDLVCTKIVLGFVTYKTPEQASKAIKELNDKTVGDLELKLQSYNQMSSARTILVTNLSKDVTENDLQNLFSDCGEIESVKLFTFKAIIKFKSDDAFCKSFLLNERELANQPIFIEPNSLLKHRLMQKKASGGKRDFNTSFGNNSGGPPNKFNKFAQNGNRPFNKRPAHQNGGSASQFKKTKKF